MIDFASLLKEANDPSTDSARLKTIYFGPQYNPTAWGLTPNEHDQIATAVLLNPNSPPDVLFHLKTNWETVKQNPALPLLQLEESKYLPRGTITFRWVKKYRGGRVVEVYSTGSFMGETILTFPEYIIIFGDGEVLSYDSSTFGKFYAYSDLNEWSNSVDETGDTTWWTLIRKFSDQGRLKKITRSQLE